MSAVTYTDAEFVEFKRLVDKTGSSNQLARIDGRMKLSSFVKEHGKEKCDAMFAKLNEEPAA